MYLSIFLQFLCDFHTVFFAHPINLKGLVLFYIFQRLIHIFDDDFTKFQDRRHFFQIPGVFQDHGQFFPGLCEPYKSMSHIICHNLWIYVVVMECRSLFSSTSCDLNLRSQFLKKCTHSRSPILYMVAFHIWFCKSDCSFSSVSIIYTLAGCVF